MSSRRHHHHHHVRSPAATPLDDDDMLSEILLRLPPQPSSLPRASAVCKRWRRLVSDPGFFRRFRLRHRRSPPLLGFFDRFNGLSFLPTLEAPNRVPPARFSLESERDDADDEGGGRSMSLGCRHGLFLILLLNRLQVLVWDPVTGDQHRIALPPGIAAYAEETVVNGAVLRSAAGDGQHFQVVLTVAVAVGDDEQHALACIYSSETCLWGSLISTPLPYEANGSRLPTMVHTADAILAGDSLYWMLNGNLVGILEFDLLNQSLAVIRLPVDICRQGSCFKMMRAEGGGLGFLFVRPSDHTAQLWKRKTGCDGVTSWMLGRTIELDKVLSLKSEEKGPLFILGFAEENNVVFLWTKIGVFMINLESLEFKNLFKTMIFSYYHPFESVYSAGACVGGGHDDELLLDT